MTEMEPGTEITLQENKAISEISQERLPLFQPTAAAARRAQVFGSKVNFCLGLSDLLGEGQLCV